MARFKSGDIVVPLVGPHRGNRCEVVEMCQEESEYSNAGYVVKRKDGVQGMFFDNELALCIDQDINKVIDNRKDIAINLKQAGKLMGGQKKKDPIKMVENYIKSVNTELKDIANAMSGDLGSKYNGLKFSKASEVFMSKLDEIVSDVTGDQQ